ncbi:MAG: hypothetical protein ACK5TF_04600 [bacterium]
MTRRDGERTRWTDEMLDELADSVSELRESVSEVKDSVSELRESVSEVRDSVSELRESVSELRESVSEVKDSVDGVRITAQALLQIAAQQQRENEARQAEIAEIRQRQEESDKRFEVLLSEVRYLIRQIKPGD